VDVDGVLGDGEAQFVGFAESDAWTDAAAGQPHGVAIDVMIAARGLAAFAHRRAAELTAPDDQCFVQQSALLEIFDQGGRPAIDFAATQRQFLFQRFAAAVQLTAPGNVTVHAKVAFAPETPLAVAYGGIIPPAGQRMVGDTVLLHGERTEDVVKGGQRLVEIVVNGAAVTSRSVPADGKIHDLQFTIPVDRSSWIALRHFPQLHTNPVNVLVAGQPIRASRQSAQWCIETIELLWKNREMRIAPHERDEAKQTFRRAIEKYRQIAERSSANQ
jgi:hypothetical protein